MRCQFLKSRPRGETKALPKHIPDGLFPPNSSPGILSQHCAQLSIQFARSCRKTLAKKMLSLVPPATSKNTSQQDTPQEVEKSLPPRLITPKIVPSRFFRPNLPHYEIPKSVPIQLRPRHVTPNAFPKNLQIVQKLSHIIGTNITQSSWRLPNVPINIFPRFDFTNRNVPTQYFSHSHCSCTALT